MSVLKFYKDSPLIVNTTQKNSTRYFNTTDSEELYKQNLKTQPKDWHYRDSEIEYRYNSYGYRSPEIEEINSKSLIGFGCSYTEGIGLHNEDIWITGLASKLNLRPFNLAMGGTGNGVIFQNNVTLFEYLQNRKITPALIIIQWTFPFRKMYAELPQEGGKYLQINITPDENLKITDKLSKMYLDKQWHFNRYVQDNSEMGLENYMFYKTVNTLWKSINVPVVNWCWGGDYKPFTFFNVDIIEIPGLGDSLARDLQHNGKEDHANIVDILSTHIDSNIVL